MKAFFLLFLCFLSALSTELFAQDSIVTKSSKLDFLDEIDQRKWRVQVPIWVPGFRGNFAYGGISQLPEGGDYDVIDRLQGELGVEFYVIGDIEYRPKKWLFEVDGFHTTLASDLKFQNIDKIEFDVGIDGTILRSLVGFRVFEKRNRDTHFKAQIYPYAGLRYFDLDIYSEEPDILEIQPSWFEPIVGVEIPIQYRRWFFSTQLDVGGFSLNNHWSYSVNVNANYRFTRLFALGAGWNFLDFNYDQDFEFKYLDLQIQLSGPVITLEFNL